MDNSNVVLEALVAPCRFELSAGLWRASAVLAGLRVAVNDPIRASDRNRGADKNWLADIWGVVGELVALRRLHELTDAPIAHCPIAFQGSVDDVDLRVQCEDGWLLLEAKAHFVQAGKSWFMVNVRARERSLARGAMGYIPVVTGLGARRALVGSLLSTTQLDAWAAPDVRLRDPAIGVPLAQLCEEQLGRSLESAEQLIESGALASAGDLGEVALLAARRLGSWRALLPALDGLRAGEVVEAVLGVERRMRAGV